VKHSVWFEANIAVCLSVLVRSVLLNNPKAHGSVVLLIRAVGKGKGKGKVHFRICHEGPDEE
jgi:hypothetical protein